MEHKVLFGSFSTKEVRQLFNLSPDAIFQDPTLPRDFRQMLMDLMDQPYLRYMLSTRRNLSGSNYHFVLDEELVGDQDLRKSVLAGFTFAWHLMGAAWVVHLVRNLGALFSAYFVTEAYEQFRITMFDGQIKHEKDPNREFSLVDDYLVVLLANMVITFPEVIHIDMIGRVFFFMDAKIEEIKVLRTRVHLVTESFNSNFTVH